MIYGVFNRPPQSVRASMDSLGLAASSEDHKLLFLDAYSPLLGTSSDAEYVINQPSDAEALFNTFKRISIEHPRAVMILDGLSALLDQFGVNTLLNATAALRACASRFLVTIALLTRWPYGAEFELVLGSFDGQVDLKGVEDRVIIKQFFNVERAAWQPQENVQSQPVLYQVIRPGGVIAYVPKIIVTGAYHAGKSTFVQTLSDTAVSVNRMGTTVALDHGRTTIDGLTADIFGTPGQERFDLLTDALFGQALGAIMVVDSTRPDSFPRAKKMLENLARRVLVPIIVAANKQDAPGALAASEVARLLELPAHIQVVGCVGRDAESAKHVLRSLLNQIMMKVPA